MTEVKTATVNAAAPSSKTQYTFEPPFVQKKKQNGHQLKRTHTTEYIDLQHNENDLPTNKALLYKAGYRRVQFDMPTEYRLQYGWPPEPSPLLKAATATTQSKGDKDTKSKKAPPPQTFEAQGETGRHRCKHVINGAPVNGRTHTVVREPLAVSQTPAASNSKDDDDGLSKERVKKMQEKFEKRMGCPEHKDQLSKPLKHGNEVTCKKKCKEHRLRKTHACTSNTEMHAHTSSLEPVRGSRRTGGGEPRKECKVKSRKQNSNQIESNKENDGNVKKPLASSSSRQEKHSNHNKHSIPSYPLATEYQSNFSREYSEDEKAFLRKQFQQSSQSIGFKDHVKDIIYFTGDPVPHPVVSSSTHQSKVSALPIPQPHSSSCIKTTMNDRETAHAPVNTANQPASSSGKVLLPHTYAPAWVTEYTSNFVSPLQMSYINGVWQGSSHPDSLVQLPEEEPSLSHRKKGVSDPSLSSEVSSWFDQVIELRKKVQEYKLRGDEGTVPPSSNDQWIRQESEDVPSKRQPVLSATPTTLSLSSLSQEEDDVSDTRDDSSCSSDRRTLSPQKLSADHCSNELIGESCEESDVIPCTCHKGLSQTQEALESDSVEQKSHSSPVSKNRPPGVKQQSLNTVTVSKPFAIPQSHKVVPSVSVPSRPKVIGSRTTAPAVLIYSKPKRTATASGPLRPHLSPVKSMHKQTSAAKQPVSSTCSRGTSPCPPHLPLHSSPPEMHLSSLTKSCKTCGATPTNNSGSNPSRHCPVPSGKCNICHYAHNQSFEARPTSKLSFRKSVPICPPSCPDYSVCKDDSFSLSSVSLPSSCSVASEILERAKQRQKNAWKNNY